jgi:predicted aldo/keto reductase-like oxidoreductase
MDRRTFLAALAASTGGIMVGAGRSVFAQDASAVSAGVATSPAPLAMGSDALGRVLPQRTLGSTGLSVTMLGVGGFHIGAQNDSGAQATIEAALEAGVRFFDNSEDYQEGGAENRYGKFLSPKYREHVFIMTKTNARDKATARAFLERSLRRMKCDYLDLWQIHEIVTKEDIDERIGEGVLEYMLEAKAEGKVRHIGFTGHSFPDVHIHTLEKSMEWETAQMPINALDPSRLSFVENTLPKLIERKVGILAMKTLAGGGFFRVRGGGGGDNVVPDRISVEEALHFVWSLPVSTLISGMDRPELIAENVKYAHSFAGLTEDDRRALVARVADLADSREWYKQRTQQPRVV